MTEPEKLITKSGREEGKKCDSFEYQVDIVFHCRWLILLKFLVGMVGVTVFGTIPAYITSITITIITIVITITKVITITNSKTCIS